MLYAFKVGPVHTQEGPFTAYVGVTDGYAFPPLTGLTARHALRSAFEAKVRLCD